MKYLRSRPVLLLIAAALIGLLAWILLTRGSDPDELTRTQFDLAVDKGDIDPSEATLKDRSNTVTGEFTEESERSGAYEFRFAAESADEIVEAYPQLDVDTEKESIWVSLAVQPAAHAAADRHLLLLHLVDAGRRQQGDAVRQVQGPQFNKDEPKVTFADVAGVDEAVEELQEIKEFLQEPGQVHADRRPDPQGRAALRPPGTGKTLLARAVAGEAGAPFFSISGVRLRRDVRRRRRQPGTRSVRAGQVGGHRRSSSSTRSTRSAGTAAPGSVAVTTSVSRP